MSRKLNLKFEYKAETKPEDGEANKVFVNTWKLAIALVVAISISLCIYVHINLDIDLQWSNKTQIEQKAEK